MSATTPILGLEYPTPGDPPDGAGQIQQLATDVEAALPLTTIVAIPATDVALTNGSWQDVATLAAIVVAGVARKVKLHAHAAAVNAHASAAASIALRIVDSFTAGTVATSGKTVVGANTAGNSDHADLQISDEILAAVGSHVYKLQAYTINGTTTLTKTESLGGETLAATRIRATY